MIFILVKKFRKLPMLRNLLKLLLLITFLFVSSLYLLLRTKYVHQLTLMSASNQPTQTIIIDRREHNVPFIKAPSFSSLLYAWGYVTAEDRIFQLAFMREMLTGRLSEMFGEATINADKMFRQLHLDSWGNHSAELMRTENQTSYQDFQKYADGINNYVDSLIFMPIDFQLVGLKWKQWEVEDIFTIYKAVEYSQASNGPQQYIRSILLKNITKQQIQDIIPWDIDRYISGVTIVRDHQISPQLKKSTRKIDLPPFTPVQIKQMLQKGMAVFSSDFGSGSNSWVISGKHTKSGKPIVCNDPHLHNALPGQWHQIGIQYKKDGQTYKMVGGSKAGLPLIVGQSDYAAFGMTTIHGDSIDWYREQIRDQKYLLDGKWLPLKKRVQIIKVKGEQDIQYPIFQTHRGPIHHYIDHFFQMLYIQQDMSFAWPGFRAGYKALLQYSHVAQFRDISSIKDRLLMSSDNAPCMNIVFATADDHIGYVSTGANPIRRNIHEGSFVKNGTTTEHDWIGLLAGQQKLHLIDPERGFIVAANNVPAGKQFQNNLFGTNIITARANRIERLIEEGISKGHKFTLQDMKQIQLDTVDQFCRTLVLQKLLQILPDDRLSGFDCDMARQSSQAAIYEVFFYNLNLLLHPIPKYSLAISHHYTQYLIKYILNAQKQNLIINQAYLNAINYLRTVFKGKEWKWSVIHEQRMIHRPFSKSSLLRAFYERNLPGRGNIHTINVGFMNKLATGDFGVYHRANLRLIMGIADQSLWITDGGTSQRFYSRYYDDQLKLHTEGKYSIMIPKSDKKPQEKQFQVDNNEL